MRLSTEISKIRRATDECATPQEKSLAVLEGIRTLIQADFAALNVTDGRRRIVGGQATPFDKTVFGKMEQLAPILNNLIEYCPIADLAWGTREGRAFAVPPPLLYSSALYKEVYRFLNMEALLFIIIPGASASYPIILGLARWNADRQFSNRETSIVEKVVSYFVTELTAEMLPQTAVPHTVSWEDHKFSVTPELQCEVLSEYAQAALCFFFNSTRRECAEGSLPKAFTELLGSLMARRFSEVISIGDGTALSFGTSRQGRRLNVLVERKSKMASLEVTIVEDYLIALRLKSVRDLCEQLPRDGSSVFAFCLALLDGVSELVPMKHYCGLQGLKDSTARRLASRAKAILAEVS